MTEKTGPVFETRALAIARAIYDRAGTQGPVMIDGLERDGVFLSDTAVTVFEFTQLLTKDKAVKDATKIADLLVKLDKDPQHRFKS